MGILKRLSAVLLALILLAGVIYLGFLSGADTNYVVWFGIASAIVAPIGLSLFGYAIRTSEAAVIQQLAKVPEIGHLMEQAQTYEEKIKVLEDERARMVEIISLESRRQAVQDRIQSLEHDAARILRELENLDDERSLFDKQIGQSAVSEEVQRLRERVRAREKGDVIFHFGSRFYRLDRELIEAIPFRLGTWLLLYFKLLERIQTWLSR